MTGQQLKNSILQLAIQGKLVPQDTNDEPATKLLERIRKEKEQLVKEGKLKKKDLVTTPITDEEKPFDIPENWEWCRFSQIVKFATNLVPPSSYLDYNHIAPDNIEKGTGRLLDFRTVREDKVISNNHLFFKGQIIYSKIRPLLRKCVKAPFDGLCSADMYPLVSYADNDFLMNILLSDFFNKQVANVCASRVKMPKINQEELSNILIPLPPLSEQHRIVEKIEELIPWVEQYGKTQKKLEELNKSLPEELKKSILQEAIMGKLVPQNPSEEPASALLARIRKEKEQLVKEGKLKKKDLVIKPITDEEIPFDIPESWEYVRVRDLCCFAQPNKRNGKYICLDAKYLRGKSEGTFLERGNYVNKSSYIILVDGENSGEVFVTPCDGYMGSTFKELFISNEVNFSYINYFFLLLKERLRRNKRGAAIPHLDKVLFFDSVIPLPPIIEQRRIVSKIEQLFKIIK